MKIKTILDFFSKTEEFVAIQQKIQDQKELFIQGSLGSHLSFVIANALPEKINLLIFNKKEDALYRLDDLIKIKPTANAIFFPSSNKRPYQLEEIDNANVLRRSEVLNYISQNEENEELVIFTYPEALVDYVIERKTFDSHSYDIKRGDKLGMRFLLDILEEYDFEKRDTVYEPGQYAVRGGIVDFYSYSFEMPFRLDFEGDEIVSIKSFDPEEQLSIHDFHRVKIIPNIKTQLTEERRLPFFNFLPTTTCVWIEDPQYLKDDLDKIFNKAESTFDHLMEISGGGNRRNTPEELYLKGDKALELLNLFSSKIIFGKNPFNKNIPTITFNTSPQPSFQKDFEILSKYLQQYKKDNYKVYIFAEEKQCQRLNEIFDQIHPDLHFEGVFENMSLGFVDNIQKVLCFTDHQIFERFYKYKVKASFDKSKRLTIKELMQLNPGDYVTHIQHGIAKYIGLETIKIGDTEQESVKLLFKGGDSLFVSVNNLHKISKYSGKDGTTPVLHKLGGTEWSAKKAKVRKRVKELAFNLVELYAKRKMTKGFAFSADTYLQQELEASFIYEDTPDQERSNNEIKRDMEKIVPMDRLVCGDVGFGKTELAIRAAFKAVCDGKQVAVLVPTTVLAFQHYKTFSDRLEKFPVNIQYINRFKTAKQQKEILRLVEAGKIDIIIGTHRLLSDDLVYKDLGLFIIDEEQRFGVGAKEKLRVKKASVDTLTLTATPIPRTLQFSLLGVRDLSIINTPPPNRQPVQTSVMKSDDELIRDAVSYEIERGGQVFFIHNRIADLDGLASKILGLVPEAKIAIAHGQLKDDQLENIMLSFIEGFNNVLIATTLVESGLDIPNANTIIINEAQTYGLSDLHQMRGRVGRSNKKAYCYLLVPSLVAMNTDAAKRLGAIEEFSELGSGLHIAMRDMDIRGAGDILGAEQSGFIGDIGYDTYHQILDEAIFELKEEFFADVFEDEIKERKSKITTDCQVDTDETILIPNTYIPNASERLNFYQRISDCGNEDDLKQISKELIDRFGLIPPQVIGLLDTIRIRELGKRLGFEKILIKNNVFKAYFTSNQEHSFFQSESFGKIIDFIQNHDKKITLKQNNSQMFLQIQGLSTMKTSLLKVKQIADYAVGVQ